MANALIPQRSLVLAQKLLKDTTAVIDKIHMARGLLRG